MKRHANEYVVKIYSGNQLTVGVHTALDKREARRLALRDYPRADRIVVAIPMPSGDVVVDDWRAS